jgi:hypothetical protein
MSTNNVTTYAQNELFARIEPTKTSALTCHSGNKWQAIKNGSWGEAHKQSFGDRAGYIICYGKKLSTVCSVIGQPFVNQTEIDANARLIELAPEMAQLIQKFAILNEDHFKDIAGFISAARELSERFILNPKS